MRWLKEVYDGDVNEICVLKKIQHFEIFFPKNFN